MQQTEASTSTSTSATWPRLPQSVRQAADRVLASNQINYWTGGKCKAFEAEYAQYLDLPFTLAVANGTLAIELALRSFCIGAASGGSADDEVIVPSRTFVATAGAVVAVGATPVIADIDPATNNLTAASAALVATPRTRALIAVHLGGLPAPMTEICNFAKQHNILVIEDCAQAHGALYRGKPVGSLADAAAFSFCQEKILPLGEGGLIAFSDKSGTGRGGRAAWERAWSYRDHGRSFAKAQNQTVSAASSQFQYLNDSFGSNARLTEVQGAMGRELLKLLPVWHKARSSNAAILQQELAEYDQLLSFVDLDSAQKDAGSRHAYYRLYARLDTQLLNAAWSRDAVIDRANARAAQQGLAAGIVQYGSSALIGREAAFSQAGIATPSSLPGAELADATSLAFFVDPGRSSADM
ncbi:MAG: DegT/DnrJ/EryC1/StrS family aminotransferase, partial [Coriobacteriia bacterium]|nr:DegT/DnrJ/EryC1/StrS family aminotransferase [Coriobacteriia bacterium]